MHCDAVIIGAGAAGLMCALEAGARGLRVVLLEHSERAGKKILISGGGRCNFTNVGATASHYITQGSPHFCKSAFARYTPQDFIRLVEKHGIAYHEKKLGQLFCDSSSRLIVEMLLQECSDAGVLLHTQTTVTAVNSLAPHPDSPENPYRFEVATSRGPFLTRHVVVATGGLSFPKLGSTDFAWRIAQQFHVQTVAPRPGLVPLTFNAADQSQFADLSGLSLDVITSSLQKAARFRENLLITHRGLSGPAILQISNYLAPGEKLSVDLLPDDPGSSFFESHRRESREIRTILSQKLPQRFAVAWCNAQAIAKPINQWSTRDLDQLAQRLHRWEIQPSGDEGYAKAEVTLGGVHTDELSSKTMEVRQVPGLHFIGEAVDVTGWLGGYNFQWAWASGAAAGRSMSPVP